jgi:hypothetical protein
MKHSLVSATLVAAATAALLVGCDNAAKAPAAADPAAAAEAAKPNPYAELNKLPDWSGVWEPARFAGRPDGPPPGAKGAAAGPPPGPPAPPKLTPEYAAKYAAFQEKNRKTPGLNFVTDVANCVPPGLPSSMNQPYPFEFLFTPGRVTILIETYSMVRRIYLDGQVKPEETDASYQGTSIGHWEGDTLVVETTNILPETSPIQGIIGHSDQFKVTERIHLEDPETLAIQTTVEDPAVFLEPYTTTSRYARHRDWHIYEYVCAQNNHDFVDEHGNAGFSLERKPGE